MSEDENRLYFLIQRTARELKRRADSELMEHCGITTAQAAVLAIIVNDGPVSQNTIAKDLMQRESAVATMTERLIKANLINRARSQTDQRAWSLTATARGQRVAELAGRRFVQINTLLDDALSGVDKRAVGEGLITLLNTLVPRDEAD